MARPQPGPARSCDGGGTGRYLVTAILSSGLVIGVAHSRWAPLIIDVAGVTAICVVACVPAVLLGVVGVLATARGRRWLGEQLAMELARRHHERMAAASPEQPLTQHLHVTPEALPLNGGGQRR